MAKKLPKAARLKIEAAVDDLFDRLKVRLLGPKSVGDKKLYISYNREKSLPGLYEAGHIATRGIPDLEHLDQLMDVASNYLEAQRLRMKSQTVTSVHNFLQDTSKHRKRGDPKPDLQEALLNELSDVYGRVTADVRRIIDTESTRVRNTGVIDGITRANASAGIEDPVVFFVVVRDNSLCPECKRLHLMEDKTTPRLWYMSELAHGYHKRGGDKANIGGLHPHCRCSMTTLMPGFGFDKGGMVTWVKEGHSEIEKQRGMKKADDERTQWDATVDHAIDGSPPEPPKVEAPKIDTAPFIRNKTMHDHVAEANLPKYELPKLAPPEKYDHAIDPPEFDDYSNSSNETLTARMDFDRGILPQHYVALARRIVNTVGTDNPPNVISIGYKTKEDMETQNRGALGTYYWGSGHIDLHENVLRDLVYGHYKNHVWGDSSDDDFHGAIKVLTHEAMHAASHRFIEYERHEEKYRPHAAMEEATTELAAQHYSGEVLRDHFKDENFSHSNRHGIERWGGFGLGLSGYGEKGAPLDVDLTEPVAYHRWCEQLGRVVAHIEGLDERRVSYTGELPDDEFEAYWQHKKDHHIALHDAITHWALRLRRMRGVDRYRTLTAALAKKYNVPVDHELTDDRHPVYKATMAIGRLLRGDYDKNKSFLESDLTLGDLRARMAEIKKKYDEDTASWGKR